ncbi:hypothetical protein VNO78_31079 [Psophocarpus tetragonolobus]|uniref:Uncharacterized protein n=1 Tax=Psophocarpus tetragonolobus TaxID=3891 RepID=A0AAN9X6J0_PSOTE
MYSSSPTIPTTLTYNGFHTEKHYASQMLLLHPILNELAILPNFLWNSVILCLGLSAMIYLPGTLQDQLVVDYVTSTGNVDVNSDNSTGSSLAFCGRSGGIYVASCHIISHL